MPRRSASRAWLGLGIAALGVTRADRAGLRDAVAVWPGFALLRDGQQFVAPLALTEAIGLGALPPGGLCCAAARSAPGPPSAAVRSGRRVGRARPARARAGAAGGGGAGVLAVLAPVVLLPGLAWGLAGRLRPVQYPADWPQARQLIDGDPHPGTVLLLPWAQYRRYPWNHDEAVFDPWPRLVGRRVIWNDALQVGPLTLAAESADSVRLNRLVTAAGPLTAALRAAGVRYVIIDAGPVLARAAAGHSAAGRSRRSACRRPGGGRPGRPRRPGPAARGPGGHGRP